MQTDYNTRRLLQTKCGRQFSTIKLTPIVKPKSLWQSYLESKPRRFLCK